MSELGEAVLEGVRAGLAEAMPIELALDDVIRAALARRRESSITVEVHAVDEHPEPRLPVMGAATSEEDAPLFMCRESDLLAVFGDLVSGPAGWEYVEARLLEIRL